MFRLHDGLTLAESRWLVLLICLVGTALFIGADVLIIRIWGMDCSISRVIGRLGAVYVSLLVALGFWFGFLVGHFYCGSP